MSDQLLRKRQAEALALDTRLRMGKLMVSWSLVDEPGAVRRLFDAAQFATTGSDDDRVRGVRTYTGTSPKFRPVGPDEEVPLYGVAVRLKRTDDGEGEITVDVEEVSGGEP